MQPGRETSATDVVSGVPDVCYVVPSLGSSDAEHFAHLPRLLEEIASQCRLVVVVEKARDAIEIRGAEVVVQRFGRSFRPLRMLELAWIGRGLRRRGCRRFFVRISITAALTLSLAGRLLGWEVYYWTSGQPSRNAPPWRLDAIGRLRVELGLLPFRLALRLVSRVVTGPERMLESYQCYFGVSPQKCIVLYNDVDLGRFMPATDGTDGAILKRRYGFAIEDPLVLFVHRMSWRRGCYDVLEIVKRQTARVQCLMVGAGPDLARIRRQIAANGLDGRIQAIGELPNRALPAIYRAADVAIMPSYEEGFPRVLLEAMACGLPVVAYDVGGVRDILGDAQQAYVVPAREISSFSAALTSVLADTELRARLREENLARVNRFDTPRVARMFVERIARA